MKWIRHSALIKEQPSCLTKLAMDGMMGVRCLLVVVLTICCATSLARVDRQKTVEFVDVTADAGIIFKHVNASSGEKYYVETIGAGCAFLDFDGDGFLDLYLVNGAVLPGFKAQGTIAGKLYRNQHD